MLKYSDWAPTPFDTTGLNLPVRQDWLVAPVSQTRDSGPLERSNFATLEANLHLHSTIDDWEVHRFGHWGPGWFEIIIVRPGSKAAEIIYETQLALENYPVLDEEDFCRLEFEEACDRWDWLSMADRVEVCVEAEVSIFAARHDAPPSEAVYILRDG